MEFQVTKYIKYKTLYISHCNTRVDSGLLDNEETIDLAIELILTAEDLLPPGYEETETKLCHAREDLEKKRRLIHVLEMVVLAK